MTDPTPTVAEPPQDDEDAIWVDIPPGYFALPLDDIAGNIATAETTLEELAPAVLRPAIAPVVEVLGHFLTELAMRNVLYCGVGHHRSALDDSTITSSLTVALQRFPEQRNPILVLKDLVESRPDAAERGHGDLVRLAGRPVVFFEGERSLPTPQIPGQPAIAEGATTRIYQIEAWVPAPDGAKLATIEFSTPAVAHGPEFRAMTVQLAASVSFEPPPSTGSPDDDNPISRALGNP